MGQPARSSGAATVRRLRPGEVGLHRALRLRALAESPAAFGERHDDVAARPPDYWARLTESFTAPGADAMFVALDAQDQPVGSCYAMRDRAEATAARLGGMWVAPEARRAGLGARLLEAAMGWAVQREFIEVRLWASAASPAAQRLYASAGFMATGERRPSESHASVELIALVRRLP